MKKLITLIFTLCFTLLSQAQNLPTEGTDSNRSAIEKEHAALFDRMIKEKTTAQRAKASAATETVSETEMINPEGLYTLHSPTELRLTQAQNLSVLGVDSTISAIEEQNAAILARMTREKTTVQRAKAPAAIETVSKTVTVKAGGLYAALTAMELSTVTNLTVNGSIDARDFVTMRDYMPLLAVVDLRGATIADYNGTLGTEGISSMDYPANMVPSYAFFNTTTHNGKYTLTSINWPSSITSIGDNAFLACSALTSISISSSVTSIGSGAFAFCGGPFTVDINNPYYSSRDGILFNKTQTLLIQATISKTGIYTIPSSVTSIRGRAFGDCSGLTSITIPSSVTFINSQAFVNCSGLTSIYAYPTIPVNLSSLFQVFYGVNTSTCILYVPSGSKSAYQSAVQWKDFQNIVEITTNSTSKSISVTAGGLSGVLTTAEKSTLTDLTITGPLDARDFVTLRDYMPKLAVLNISGTSIVAYTGTGGTKGTYSYTYPASEIPQNAFFNSTTTTFNRTLTSINLPNNLTSIGDDAFEFCSLISVDIPTSVNTIGDYAFFGCSDLTSVNLSSSVTSVGEGAFAHIYGSINVATNNLNYSSQNGILFDKNKATLIQCSTSQPGSYTTPLTVTAIGGWAFYYCANLTSINLSSSVTSIGAFSFNGTKISSINIPSSVITINTGNCSFRDFSGLINVEANNLYYSSQDGVLFNKNKTLLIQCPLIKTGEYTIPSTVTTIIDWAFDDCKNLTLINITASVSTIGTWTFASCTGLTSFVFSASVTSIGSYALFACRNLTSIKTLKTVPVDLSTAKDVFWSVDKTTCILYVPRGSKSVYQSAYQWKDFSNIVEMDIPNGINEPDLSSLTKIYASSQTVYVRFSENPKNARIAIYDMNGRLIISKIADEELTAIPISRCGIYVVRVEAENKMQTGKIIIQ